MPWLARPVARGAPLIRVSKAAARAWPFPMPLSHSRSPGPGASGSSVSPLASLRAACAAIRRVPALDRDEDMKLRMIIVAGAMMLAGGTGAVVATVPAGAAPAASAASAPAMGIYAGYIGAQVNGYGYAMDVQSGFAVPGWPLISWPFSATDPAQQFYWFTYAGSDETHPYGSPVKIAEYAPNGHLTNLVMADIGKGVIELRVANGSNPAVGLERLRLDQ